MGREPFAEHLRAVESAAERALARAREAGAAFDGIVLHAGSTSHYHADDLTVPFRTTPHFLRFAPVPGPGHLLRVCPGERTRLAWVRPADYWEEPAALPDHPFREMLEVSEVPDPLAGAVILGDLSRFAYVGNDPELAARLGIAPEGVEPAPLMAALDWHRGFKTPYEVACIREAGRVAGRGHAAARAGFAAGRSEREIHADYLRATEALEHETPYPNIIAWDDRASVLHYQRKRETPPRPGRTFLIDAGARVHGYASDVTRSYARADAHPAFREALDRMEALQRELVAGVAPGVSFVSLHARAVLGVARILRDIGVLSCSEDETLEKGLALPFLPHGLGHHLGLQVHDVGGQQLDEAGRSRPPPEAHPYLRTTRDLAPGHVITIEPGLYFVPQLLAPHRVGGEAAAFDWTLVDELSSCGGIRIEDDVLVTAGGGEDLTRPFVPGHQEAPIGPEGAAEPDA